MNFHCVSGKRVYQSQLIAEDMLIELWTQNDYNHGIGPVSIYRCDDCGLYHHTSSGPMNDRLAAYLKSDKYRLSKQAGKWEDKFKRR